MPAEAARRPGFWRALGAALRRALLERERLPQLALRSERQATQRSLALLVRCLDAAQRDEFERMHRFTVRAPSGRRYRIAYGATANIDMIGEAGQVLCRLCARPFEVPVPAVMLSQKLMLETQEAEFLRLAARHEVLAVRPVRVGDYAGI